MCQIMMKLKGIELNPISSNLENFHKMSVAIDNIGKIVENNVVITPSNRQKIIEAINSVYKRTRTHK